jgi:hypothetical protein
LAYPTPVESRELLMRAALRSLPVKKAEGLASSNVSPLEQDRLCSGDPVCADHDPVAAADDRTLHGAACHGCLLVAETSCEARNLFLDRALLVDTVGPTGTGFF